MTVAIASELTPGGFNSVNEYLNILQSMQLPFAMLPALHFAASAPLLGRFRSHPMLMVVSTALAAVVLGTNAYFIWSFVDALERTTAVVAAATIGTSAYAFICLRLVWDDIRAAGRRLCRLLCGGLGSSAAYLRYKLARCGAILLGADTPYDADKDGHNSLTRELIDADANLEGELLGRILTPSALRAAASPSAKPSASVGPTAAAATATTATAARDATAGARCNLSGALGRAAAADGGRPLSDSRDLSASSLSAYSDAHGDSTDSLTTLGSAPTASSMYEPPRAPPASIGGHGVGHGATDSSHSHPSAAPLEEPPRPRGGRRRFFPR